MSRPVTRRQLTGLLGASALAQVQDTKPSAATTKSNMFGLEFEMPARPDQVVMLAYPGMTALDLIGPQQVFGYTMGAEVHLVWKNLDPITTDTGLRLLPSKTFATAPKQADILFVPGGGRETIALMEDREVTAYLAETGRTARYVTSVCSGSLVLGAAGLLRGYKAISHWAVRDVLPLLGAQAVEARYVEDRNRITAGGITSGIDFGLRIAGKLRGDDYARGLELNLEYDPEPPYRGGSPAKALPRVRDAMSRMYQPLNQMAKAAAGRLKLSA